MSSTGPSCRGSAGTRMTHGSRSTNAASQCFQVLDVPSGRPRAAVRAAEIDSELLAARSAAIIWSGLIWPAEVAASCSSTNSSCTAHPTSKRHFASLLSISPPPFRAQPARLTRNSLCPGLSRSKLRASRRFTNSNAIPPNATSFSKTKWVRRSGRISWERTPSKSGEALPSHLL